MSDKLYSPLIQDPVTKQFYKRELNTHTGIVVRTQGGHCYINGSENKLDLSNCTQEPPKPITHEMFNKLIKQRDQFKAERDTCLLDIDKLRKEKEQLEKGLANLFNMNVERLNLLTEISQHIGSNPSSGTYKKFRKQLDDIGIRERADDER